MLVIFRLCYVHSGRQSCVRKSRKEKNYRPGRRAVGSEITTRQDIYKSATEGCVVGRGKGKKYRSPASCQSYQRTQTAAGSILSQLG